MNLINELNNCVKTNLNKEELVVISKRQIIEI